MTFSKSLCLSRSCTTTAAASIRVPYSSSSSSNSHQIFNIQYLTNTQLQHCLKQYFPHVNKKAHGVIRDHIWGHRVREVILGASSSSQGSSRGVGTSSSVASSSHHHHHQDILDRNRRITGIHAPHEDDTKKQSIPSNPSNASSSSSPSNTHHITTTPTPTTIKSPHSHIKMPKILQQQLRDKVKQKTRASMSKSAAALSSTTNFIPWHQPQKLREEAANPASPLLSTPLQPAEAAHRNYQYSTQITHPFFDTHFHIFNFMRQFHLHRVDLLDMRQMLWSKDYWKQDAVPCICRFSDLAQAQKSHAKSTWEEIFNQTQFWPMYGVFGLRAEFSQFFNDRIHERLKENISHERCVGVGDLGLLYEYGGRRRPQRGDNVRKRLPHNEDSTLESTEEYFSPKRTSGGDQDSLDNLLQSRVITPEDERQQQRQLFKLLLQLAVEEKKSITVKPPQTEEELKDFMSLLRDNVPRDWKIHVHPLNGNAHPDFVHTIQEEFSEVYFGLNAELLTLHSSPNEEYEAMVRAIPLNRCTLGTDSPLSSSLVTQAVTYSALQIVTPVHIPLMAKALSKIHDTSILNVAVSTRMNVGSVYEV